MNGAVVGWIRCALCTVIHHCVPNQGGLRQKAPNPPSGSVRNDKETVKFFNVLFTLIYLAIGFDKFNLHISVELRKRISLI